jgi:hemolysin activation/secretion protein
MIVVGLQIAGVGSALGQTNPPAAKPKPTESQKPLYDGAENIRGIVVVASYDDVNPAGVKGIKGVVVKGPKFLQETDFKTMVYWHLNEPLTQASLEQLQVEIIKYCRARGHLVVDVFLREQDIVEGTIQIAVIEGKVGKIMVQNDGKKWFSDKLILGEIRLREGDAVIENRMNSDLAWLNNNTYQSLTYFDGSFRDVRASFQQGGLGETDVKLTVQDRFPLRVFAGYDDAGLPVIGENRVFAGLNYGNVWGLDHRVNYQYITDTSFNEFKANVASYIIPLPWHHELIFFGAYALTDPNYADVPYNNPPPPGLTSPGQQWQTSIRYAIPLPPQRNYEHELTLGFDYKNTDSPLLFTGSPTPVLANEIAVLQFTLDYRATLRDDLGRTSISLQGVYSPGDLTALNTDQAFNGFTAGSKANYAYGKVDLRRETLLPGGLVWVFRGSGQFASGTLIATESFGVGGYSTVRGYDERTVVGDGGWILSNQLNLPWFSPIGLIGKGKAMDQLQFHVFCDYGGNVYHNPTSPTGYGYDLLGVGGGFLYTFLDNCRIRLDYGYQLNRDYESNPTAYYESWGRIHLGAELSY